MLVKSMACFWGIYGVVSLVCCLGPSMIKEELMPTYWSIYFISHSIYGWWINKLGSYTDSTSLNKLTVCTTSTNWCCQHISRGNLEESEVAGYHNSFNFQSTHFCIKFCVIKKAKTSPEAQLFNNFNGSFNFWSTKKMSSIMTKI